MTSTRSGFTDPPPFAAFRHREAREGFEVVFARATAAGVTFDGHTSAVEEGEPFAVAYSIELDRRWHTRKAHIRGQSLGGATESIIRADGKGRWEIDGAPAPHLDGCLDLDLESSALTNAFPVRRLALQVGEQAEAPAAYVRAVDLSAQRLEQRYERIADGVDGRQRFAYAAPRFDVECVLEYDRDGLVLAYPGIGTRAA